MAYFFRANEIARTAVEIERKGRAFYMNLVEAAGNDKTRELFRHLADEEARHESIFRGLMDRLGDVELPAWTSNEEYATYMQGLIESHSLFTADSVDNKKAVLSDEKEAVRMAMCFEKDTLLFFTEMEALVPDREKDAVRECIHEERRHLALLQNMMKDM